MRRLAAGLVIACMFVIGCEGAKTTPKTGVKTEPAKTVEKTADAKTK
jgi:hypothetical protein